MIKKVLILSDSHGTMARERNIIRDEAPDMVIHLGDIKWDIDFAEEQAGVPHKPLILIEGNCDDFDPKRRLKRVATFNLNNHRVFATHGHEFGLDSGIDYGVQKLVYSAHENDCDIVMFGHTHVPFDEEIDGVRVLNPGSTMLPRGGSRASYMIMTFENEDDYTIELKEMRPDKK